MPEASLAAVRKAVLEQQAFQRVCAWCGKDCQDADWLYFHLILRHPQEVHYNAV